MNTPSAVPPPPPRPPSANGTDLRTEERIRRLENRVSTLRTRGRILGALAVLALLAAVVPWVSPDLPARLGPGPAPAVIQARSIELLDGDGRVRGEWSVDPSGTARFSLLDTQARPRMNLAVLSSGSPGMALLNQGGQRRTVLGILPDQTTTLVFADGNGIPRAVLGMTRDDAANLVFADAEGVSRVGMGLDGSGTGTLLMPSDSSATPGALSVPGSEMP